ncbi:hypothetical protein [Fodinicola acaciae]|uniref:hypothetical protein n=1 Tax=Fodinicola acaciae TaxID=2681555 RepID=UPI0013D64ADE|nr:hypothetical protein [Fodinicola acaciae]
MSNYGDPNYGQQGGQGGYGGDPYGSQPGDPTYQGGGYGDPTYQGQPGGYADPNSAPPGYGAPGYADPNSAPPGYGPGGPGYGDPGFGTPPPPPPPKKSSTGLIIGIVIGVVVLLLCVGGGVGAFFYFKPGSNPSPSSSGGGGGGGGAPQASGGTNQGGGSGPNASVGSTHKAPADACAPVDLQTFSSKFQFAPDSGHSPNPKGEINRYGDSTETDCKGYYVQGNLNPEIELEMTIQTGSNPTADASSDYDREKQSSDRVYGNPINVTGIGQKATGYKSSSGALHLYVLDGNTVVHVEYFNAGSDHAVSQGKDFQDAITTLAQTALNRTV